MVWEGTCKDIKDSSSFQVKVGDAGGTCMRLLDQCIKRRSHTPLWLKVANERVEFIRKSPEFNPYLQTYGRIEARLARLAGAWKISHQPAAPSGENRRSQGKSTLSPFPGFARPSANEVRTSFVGRCENS